MRRRSFLGAAAAAGLRKFGAAQGPAIPEDIRNLQPMTAGVKPITTAERQSRVEKARRLMRDNGLAALYMESGSSMFYFTGRREAGAGYLLTGSGEPVAIAAADRYRTAAAAIKDRKSAGAKMGLEEEVPFAAFDALRKELPAAEFVNATPVTAGCRMIKSAAEIALLQRANEVTIAAFRAAFAHLREGMTQNDLSQIIAAAATARSGTRGTRWSASASIRRFRTVAFSRRNCGQGDFVLVDGGCTVEGYQSDMTRTVVFGKPTARQQQIWTLERRRRTRHYGRRTSARRAKSVDAAARKVITDAGFGPDYKVPGLPHRTGHGIGLDGHEWTYLVRGNKTPLAAGHVLQRRTDYRYLRGVRRAPGRLLLHDAVGAANVHQAESGYRPAIRISRRRRSETRDCMHSRACPERGDGPGNAG